VECLVDDMLGHYDEMSNATLISQPQAMQLLLDVKYLTMLLVPRENKVMHNSGLLSGKKTKKLDNEFLNRENCVTSMILLKFEIYTVCSNTIISQIPYLLA
jgi:hypothetical protein